MLSHTKNANFLHKRLKTYKRQVWTYFEKNTLGCDNLFSKFSGLFEGDILIDEDTERYLTGGEMMSRDAVVTPILYWPKGVVYYMFDEKLGLLLQLIESLCFSLHTVNALLLALLVTSPSGS